MLLRVKILGISGSIRHGNSEYLLMRALDAAKKVAPELVDTEFVSTAGLIINPCIHCLACVDHRKCIIKDDFNDLFDKWLEADAIIYSIPVFHLGIPAHFKAFIDRLGQTLFAKYLDKPPKLLKVIGVITQGTDLGGGGELTAIQIISHALVMGCIPVAGDPPESYIGAIGWTKRSPLPDAIERLATEKDFDANTTVSAAESLGRRVAYTSLIIKNGAKVLTGLLSKDPWYSLYLSKIT
ncbi:MAG: flavodoxin family protein [Zestosphaera sp.]